MFRSLLSLVPISAAYLWFVIWPSRFHHSDILYNCFLSLDDHSRSYNILSTLQCVLSHLLTATNSLYSWWCIGPNTKYAVKLTWQLLSSVKGSSQTRKHYPLLLRCEWSDSMVINTNFDFIRVFCNKPGTIWTFRKKSLLTRSIHTVDSEQMSKYPILAYAFSEYQIYPISSLQYYCFSM